MAGEEDLVAGELTVGGRVRTFTMRLPRRVTPGPLVIALHGNHPDAGGWLVRKWTSFERQADAWGYAVAYPDGYGGCWADGRGVTTADEAGADDVAFLRAIIDWSAQPYPDGTVVSGVSNGAFMAHRMALEASDQVAVLAAVAGGMPATLHDQCPSHAVSAMLIHGTADTVSPIEGGYSRHLGPTGNCAAGRCRSGRRLRAGVPSTGARPDRGRRAPPSSRARPLRPAASAERGWSNGHCSVAVTPGRVRPPRPSWPT
jgi:polyhydroxybutyrate depolymerase